MSLLGMAKRAQSTTTAARSRDAPSPSRAKAKASAGPAASAASAATDRRLLREPFFLAERHEVRVDDYNDVDWTLREDWTEELRLREVRNCLIRDQLRAGKTVAHRSSG